MDSMMSISQSQLIFKKPQLAIFRNPKPNFLSLPMLSTYALKKPRMTAIVVSATGYGEQTRPKMQSPEVKGFAEEMRYTALKMHTRAQAKEGEREPNGPPISEWEATVEGCLRFLVDSKLVYDTLERIVEKAAFPEYAEFRNTRLERSERLVKDLEWCKQQGYSIPKVSSPGVKFAEYLEDLSERDPQAFICCFYNIYFGHKAGGRIIGKKVADILDGKELEFYKWDGDLSQILQNVRDKLNNVAQGWSREEKDRCLKETPMPLKLGGAIARLIIS